jgi:cobyrinic acid a,c-diamide synthase
LIIAAPASGSGKTLVTAGLLRHLRRRGVRAVGAKAGPDFIDPTYHAAAGAPCVNLDVWAMRPAVLAALVTRLGKTADLVLCEGVMGLFDGTGADGETGSTAELARMTGWPVVLVIDARGQGASSAALLRGFVLHRTDISIAGVIFNRVASERHRSVLCGAVARNLPNLAVLGTLPADPAVTLPSRHLGLVPAEEATTAESALALAAAHIASGIDIDRLVQLARPATLAGEASSIGIPPLGQRIAIARDDAFRFSYPVLLAGWQRAGAELSYFSPLANEPTDPLADAVYLPGGYPELWADRLAAAEGFLSSLRRAAILRKPIYGECGGYMVLGRALTDATGRTHRMADLLPLETSFAARKLQLGYRSATLLSNGPLGRAGSAFRGHEFRYATVIHEDGAEKLWSVSDAAGADLGHCGLRHDSVLGSFIHLIDSADPTALT